MPTAVAGESYNCPCGAWRWVESARERGEKQCIKCNRPFQQKDIGLRRLTRPAKATAKAKAAGAKPKAKAKPKATAGQRDGAPRRSWLDVVKGMGSPTEGRSAEAAGSGDRADVLRETLELYERHGYSADRTEVQSAKAELAELLRERQSRLPPAERVAAIHSKLQGVQKDHQQSAAAAEKTREEIKRLQARLVSEDKRTVEFREEAEELEKELEAAQRALPVSQRPLPVGVRRYAPAEDADEDLDMALGRAEEKFMSMYSTSMDDTAREILRKTMAKCSEEVHELASRLETNEAERRFRERKRATETAGAGDGMADIGDDAEDWQAAQRRSRRMGSSTTGSLGPQAPTGPERASGTPAQPSADGVGTLTAGLAASLQAAAATATPGQTHPVT